MSVGRSSGRTGSFARERKDKRKKQEFHKHKLRLKDDQKPDFALVKEKTRLSLASLGKQKFSQAPGGYGFENWMKSLNLLLDDFEQSAGPQNLPKEYFEQRQKIASSLFPKKVVSDADSEVTKLQEKERAIEVGLQKLGAKLTHARVNSERAAKIDVLNVERANLIEELEGERRKLAQKKKDAEDSKKFFKKIFSRGKGTGPAIALISAKINALEANVKNLEKRISELRGRKDQSGYRILSEGELKQEFPQQFSDLEEVRAKIEELQSKRLDENEGLLAREKVTKSLSELISKMELPKGEANGDQNTTPETR